MLALDSLYLDIILPATAQPTAELLAEGLGGEEVLGARMVVDIDVDLPQIEAEVSPTFLIRRRGERRFWVIEEGPLRADPRTQPIITRDLRPERDRLVQLVETTGARLGRMGAFGSWGDAVVVTRSARDLRAVLLQSWALDPTTDVDGRTRSQQLSQREFELKLAAFGKRLDELDDATILRLVPPATLERRGPPGKELLIVSVLSGRDGSWDPRTSEELERRVAAVKMFSRIAGARQTLTPEPEPTPAPLVAGDSPGPPGPPGPPPPPEPPRPAGPPIRAAELGGRLILVIPSERLDSETVTTLGKRPLEVLSAADPVPGKVRDRIHQEGCGFVAPLAFLSEVFLEGKPLDRKRFEAEARPAQGGIRVLDAHLPRFGGVRVLERAGKRFLTSEPTGDPAALLALLG